MNITGLDMEGKRVVVRLDMDVPVKDGRVMDATRLDTEVPTLNYVADKATTVVILGHLGRPEGKVVEALSLKPVISELRVRLAKPEKYEFLENLRFDPGEEANDDDYVQSLSGLGDVYVNEAFATAHRNHASIIGIPRYLPSVLGFQFVKEMMALDKVLTNPKRPVVLVMGGAKAETKWPLVNQLLPKVDMVLVGGKLAEETQNAKLKIQNYSSKLKTAELREDGLDITEESAKEFSQIISQAGTVVWNGPMGVFEKEESAEGTRIICQAIDQAKGYTVIGGGDTEAAATKFEAEKGIDHISAGGGAMLTYLATGTLPAMDAIKKSPIGNR